MPRLRSRSVVNALPSAQHEINVKNVKSSLPITRSRSLRSKNVNIISEAGQRPGPRHNTKARLKRPKQKQQPPLDPYALDQLDDEKENIDPQKQQVARKPRARRNVASSKPVFGTDAAAHHHVPKRNPVTDPVHLHQLSATIRLPLIPQRQSTSHPRLTATPLVPHAPLASTPALQTQPKSFTATGHPIISPVTRTVPTSSNDTSDGPIFHRPSLISVEPFVDEATAPTTEAVSLDSSGNASKRSRSSNRSRNMSSSEEEAYSSWLQEFNEQLEHFASHELTIEEDHSNLSKIN